MTGGADEVERVLASRSESAAYYERAWLPVAIALATKSRGARDERGARRPGPYGG